MAGEIHETHHIQQGSSNTLLVADESAWYVVREVWEGSKLLNSQVVCKRQERSEALEILRELELAFQFMWLCDLSLATGIPHVTLRLALNQGRLEGRKEGGRWRSSVAAVNEAIAKGQMRHRQ